MPLHIRFNLAVEVKGVGVLALMGIHTHQKCNDDDDDYGIDGTTSVVFLLQYHIDAPLADYLFTYFSSPETEPILYSLRCKNDINSVTDEDVRFCWFTRQTQKSLRDPVKFLHATADKLLKELRQTKEQRASFDGVMSGRGDPREVDGISHAEDYYDGYE